MIELTPKELRECGRGGLLDQSHGENGLQQILSLGNQVDVLQISSKNGGADPRIVNVGVDVEELTPPGNNGIAVVRLQTVLTWGSGKGKSSAIVDTRNGSQITLSASILNVAVRYVNPTPATLPATVSQTYLVSGSVSYGSRPGAANPALTFTSPERILALAATVQEPIPKYATAVCWVNDRDPQGATPPIGVLRFRGGLIGASTKVLSQALPATNVFIPIPNGAHIVDLLNGSGVGAPASGFRLIYEIGL